MKTVISLYDLTTIAVQPWANMGYACFCFDNQHSYSQTTENVGVFGGSITRINADLHDKQTLSDIVKDFRNTAVFMSAFPECTDMAVSGSRHFEKKRVEDPLFAQTAAEYARWCGFVGDELGCPYYVENPVSTLSTLWRKSDYLFDPYEYGGYIDECEAEHPQYPDYIAPFDAYTKKTCLWVGNGFVMPEKKPVSLLEEGQYSKQHRKLGGKSLKTKNIRSATPRGFTKAVALVNAR